MTLDIFQYVLTFNLFVVLLYFFYRNNKVYQFNLLKIESGEYANVPSYDYILFKRFWVWPLDKFLDKKHLGE